MNRHKGDTKTLEAMLDIYCREKHESIGRLCPECGELLDYAMVRLAKCPFGDKKPTCAQCTIHCYKPDMRARTREIMKYAGPRMLKAHPVMAVRHLVHGILRKPSRKASPSK